MVEAFYDNMDLLDGPSVIVEARLSLLPEDEGGHWLSAQHGHRPNHNFGDAANRFFFIGQVEFEGGDFLAGETRDVTVTFPPVRGLLEELTDGRRWRIQEGSRLIGTAELLRVVQPNKRINPSARR